MALFGWEEKKLFISSRCPCAVLGLFVFNAASAAVSSGFKRRVLRREGVPKARPPLSGGVVTHWSIILRQIYIYICIYKYI